jgi:protein-S-isoprenylcysteine O-methyltransferase Ste14
LIGRLETGVSVGFLLQWPTLVTLIMFPILVTMYVKLARSEEREVMAEFGEQYRRYAAITPAFIPRLYQAKSTA